MIYLGKEILLSRWTDQKWTIGKIIFIDRNDLGLKVKLLIDI